MFQDVATKEWFQTSSILELKGNDTGLSSARKLLEFETFQDMDILDLSEPFGYYKNYGQIIVGK